MDKVYLVPAKSSDTDDELTRKIGLVWRAARFENCFRANDLTPLKLHVGEPGKKTFVPPRIVAPLVGHLKETGARPFLTDSAVLYRSPRDNGVSHTRVAHEHGFTMERTGAPFLPADGLNGSDEVEMSTGGKHFESVSIAAPNLRSSLPHQLTVGPKVHLLAPAHRLLAAVYTIGPALGARVGELAKEGDLLLSYLLDCVGVMALGAVGERVSSMAQETAAAGGWGVGPALSPGSLVGWSIQGQRELCDVLPIGDIGVGLNKYCVLEPHKSASVVIGMGPGFGSHEVGSVCAYCSLRDSCWRRRGGDA